MRDMRSPNPTIIQIQKQDALGLWTLMLIFPATNQKRHIWRIRYDYLENLMQASELLMLSTIKELPAQSWDGDGEPTKVQIRIPATSTSVSQRLGMQMVHSSKFHYLGVNMKIKNPQILLVGAFLAAWANSEFALDYKSVLLALLAGVFGYATPKK